MGDGIEEDAIEATIRRVAAAKAARSAPDSESAAEVAEATQGAHGAATEAPDAEAIRAAEVNRVETMIRRVASAKAARDTEEPAVPPGEPGATAAPALTPAEELIEATIRRVADAKAAQRHDPGGDDNPVPGPATPAEATASGIPPDGEPRAARPGANGRGWRPAERTAIRESDTAEGRTGAAEPTEPRRPAEPSSPAERRQPAEASASVTPPTDSGAGFTHEDSGLAEVVADLRRELDATRRSLEALVARVDAMTAPPGASATLAAPPSTPADEDWDDTPTIPRVPLGQPLRPAIFRDPSPRTATADQIVLEDDEVVIDTRPIPKPLPPLRAEARRGLDLLPRTYRVTVEDKRRGVDLVPLHRALLGMDGVRDMSLLSYSNGVAIVSLDTLDELSPDALCAAIARAMSRKATVEAHNEAMVVKLAEE